MHDPRSIDPFNFFLLQLVMMGAVLFIASRIGFDLYISMFIVFLLVMMIITLWFVPKELRNYLAEVRTETNSTFGLVLRMIADGLSTPTIFLMIMTVFLFENGSTAMGLIIGAVTVILTIFIFWLLHLSKNI